MRQVHYTRIFRIKSSSSSLRLFIRDFPVIEFLILVIVLFSDSADAAVTPPIKEGSIINSTGFVLRTCCPFQSQYNAEYDRCTDLSERGNDLQHETFPGTFTVPDHLISRAYRNLTYETKFRLKQQTISCPNNTRAITVALSPPDTNLTAEKRRMDFTAWTPVNGYLRHSFDVFYPDEYCFNKISDLEAEIMACEPDCSEERPCVSKCCDVGQVWDLTKYPDGPARCTFAGEKQWSPEIYSELKSKKPIDAVRPHIIISHPRYWCEEDSTIHTLKPFMGEKKRPFRLLQSGDMWYKFDRRKWTTFTKGAYCVDGSFVRNGLDGKGQYSGRYEDTIVWDCGPPLVTPKTIGTSELYGVSMVIAAFFLLITITVYGLLWDKQNVHGWTLLCYFTSLFFMYIFYSAVHFTSLSLKQDAIYGGGTACYIIGVFAHFFFLASFCFMSSVNFDLYWTFRALMPTGGKSKGLKKFLAYNLFSLGIPTIIVAVGITLDQIYRDDPDSDIIIPEYGKKICYLDKQYATLPYMYAPAGVLLTCNLMFFTTTVYTMYKIQQSTKFATMSSSKNAKQKQSMVLFAKLFLVMGLPWIFEVISSTTQQGVIVPIYFKILDMINIFQAVAIFIIFVVKVDIRNSLENKYPRFQRMLCRRDVQSDQASRECDKINLRLTHRPLISQKSQQEPLDNTLICVWFSGFMLAITIRPEKADSILRRHPRLRFIINPLTRSITSSRSFSTAKTTLSNGTEASTSSRANVLGRRSSDDLESTSSCSGGSSPSGSLGEKRSHRKKSQPLEILELK